MFLLTLGLAACSHTSYKLEPITECYFPDATSDKAPLWVCDAPVDGLAITGVGSTNKSKGGEQFMKEQAAANARVFLAQQLKTRIVNEIKNSVQTTGTGSDETATNTASALTSQITNAALVGAKIYRSATSPNGTLYILVGMNKADLDATLKLASDKSKVDLSSTKLNNLSNAVATPVAPVNSTATPANVETTTTTKQ